MQYQNKEVLANRHYSV